MIIQILFKAAALSRAAQKIPGLAPLFLAAAVNCKLSHKAENLLRRQGWQLEGTDHGNYFGYSYDVMDQAGCKISNSHPRFLRASLIAEQVCAPAWHDEVFGQKSNKMIGAENASGPLSIKEQAIIQKEEALNSLLYNKNVIDQIRVGRNLSLAAFTAVVGIGFKALYDGDADAAFMSALAAAQSILMPVSTQCWMYLKEHNLDREIRSAKRDLTSSILAPD